MIPDDDGYFIEIKELPGCMSQGENQDEALSNIQEAKELWLETALKKNRKIPEPQTEENYSGKFVVRLPKSLHAKISKRAKEENTSINQLVVSMLSEQHGAYEMIKKLERCIDKIERQKDHEHELLTRSYIQTSIPKKEHYDSIYNENYNTQGAENENLRFQ